MKALLILAVAALGVYVLYRCYYTLNLDGNLRTHLRSGAVILDVRTPVEWERGHISGAVNIALSRLHSGPVPIDTSQTIITCCSHGLRSVKAVSVLRARGYRHVYNGGAWTDLEALLAADR